MLFSSQFALHLENKNFFRRSTSTSNYSLCIHITCFLAGVCFSLFKSVELYYYFDLLACLFENFRYASIKRPVKSGWKSTFDIWSKMNLIEIENLTERIIHDDKQILFLQRKWKSLWKSYEKIIMEFIQRARMTLKVYHAFLSNIQFGTWNLIL